MRAQRLAGTLFLMALALFVSVGLTAQPVSAQSLFGATATTPGNFYSIDPTTGAATLIGATTGFDKVSGLAFHPTTGVLYAVGLRASDSSHVLLTIDPATGVGTEVGPTNVLSAAQADTVSDISFRSDGTLYTYAAQSDTVGTIDTSTGAFTVVGLSGHGGTGNGIAFSPTDVLFFAPANRLETLDQTTGARTLVAGLTFPGTCDASDPLRRARVNAMDFQPGTDTLFGVLNCSGSTWRIATIDTSTGAITDIGPTVNVLDAIAFVPSPGESLSALSPAKLWIGLQNSDAVGLRVDVLAEVFIREGAAERKVGEGNLLNVSTGSSGFNKAILYTIANMGLTSGPVTIPAGAALELKVSVRRTCTGGGHASGTVRLWYDGKKVDSGATRDAGSRFDATIAGSTDDYFLRASLVLSKIAGSARTFVDKFVNSASACPGRPFTAFSAAWSVTP